MMHGVILAQATPWTLAARSPSGAPNGVDLRVAHFGICVADRLLARPATGQAATSQLCRQGIQRLLPRIEQLIEPARRRGQLRLINPVEPGGSGHPDPYELTLAQHLKVLRTSRLRQPELLLELARQHTCRHFTGPDQLQNPAPDRLTNCIQRLRSWLRPGVRDHYPADPTGSAPASLSPR